MWDFKRVLAKSMVEKVFRFTAGQTVFVGTMSPENGGVFFGMRARLYREDILVREFSVEGEMLPNIRDLERLREWREKKGRVISTRDAEVREVNFESGEMGVVFLGEEGESG